MLQPQQRTAKAISRKLHELRRSRLWTQVELAKRLGLSQGRLSEIERGKGSLSAEQFITVLKLFNVSVNDFVKANARDSGGELQNALARFGAVHLRENDEIIASERYDRVEALIRDVLATAESPRHITALAPVLVLRIDELNLGVLALRLSEIGLQYRLAWLLENILGALRLELEKPLPKKWQLAYRRAELVLNAFLKLGPTANWPTSPAPDFLDKTIRSAKTYEETTAVASPISKRWKVISSFQAGDFAQALADCRGPG